MFSLSLSHIFVVMLDSVPYFVCFPSICAFQKMLTLLLIFGTLSGGLAFLPAIFVYRNW